MSGLLVLFLIFDGVTKVVKQVDVLQAFNRLGIPVDRAPGIGILVLICALVYAVPRTRVLGAILVTGLLGGAVATHVRAGSPLFEAYVFPFLMGVLTWAPLLLKDARVRALVPFCDESPR